MRCTSLEGCMQGCTGANEHGHVHKGTVVEDGDASCRVIPHTVLRAGSRRSCVWQG